MNTYKLLPYGISDFRRIRKENYYYVDKSAYIQRMEDVASFLFLIRPRHFGKSLFLSMLRYYYDINEKENFRELFKGLWVADHPTQWQISSAALRLLASRRKCRCTPFEFQPLLRSAVRRFCRTLCRLLSRRLCRKNKRSARRKHQVRPYHCSSQRTQP